jgi:hypothetical protein
VASRPLELHHIGCLCESIERAAPSYACVAAAPVPDAVYITSQKVHVLMLPMANGVALELVQPDSDNRFLQRLLGKGVSFYHLAFLCDDVAGAAVGFPGARELGSFESEAFAGRRCMFIVLPDGQMIELIERAAP